MLLHRNFTAKYLRCSYLQLFALIFQVKRYNFGLCWFLSFSRDFWRERTWKNSLAIMCLNLTWPRPRPHGPRQPQLAVAQTLTIKGTQQHQLFEQSCRNGTLFASLAASFPISFLVRYTYRSRISKAGTIGKGKLIRICPQRSLFVLPFKQFCKCLRAKISTFFYWARFTDSFDTPFAN